MNRMPRIIIMAAVLVAALHGWAAAAPGEPYVRVSVDRRAILIGDRIIYKIEASCPRGSQAELPKFKDNTAGDFEIKDSGSRTESLLFGGKKYTAWYAITAYTPGKYKTPAAAVRFRGPKDADWKAKGLNQIDIRVDSVLPKDAKPTGVRDIKGPLAPFSPNYGLIAAIAAAIALAAFAIISYIRYRSRVPPRSPYEIAVAELADAKAFLASSSDIKAYYVKVSDCIRKYIENVFDLRAPEMTTQEFLYSLQAAGQLPPEYKELLKEFMEACDLVKFARYVPAQKEAESVLTAAGNFIEGTKSLLETKKEKS